MNKYYCYEEYLKSDEWKIIKRLAKESANGKCRFCNSTENLQVHHRKYFKNWGQERLCDLTVLCENCHSLAHACIIGNFELETATMGIREYMDYLKAKSSEMHDVIKKTCIIMQYAATVILFFREDAHSDSDEMWSFMINNRENIERNADDDFGYDVRVII